MDYTHQYFELRKIFNQKESKIIVDEDIEIANIPFDSQSVWPEIRNEQDTLYPENNHFVYSIFLPRKLKNYDRVIILLHGLNERYWDKYLPWAYYLAHETHVPVILFPIAFHMNRGPIKWTNAKELEPLLTNRKKQFDTQALTFANVALSMRLTDDPLRFLKSGHQTAEDLLMLIKQLEQGILPFFKKGTKCNVFAYSIGAFVSQILFLAHSNDLLRNSKLFLFCGGAFFNEMNGVSRLIMDQVAFDSIKTYYTSDINKALNENKPLNSLITEFPLGKAFYAMLKKDNNKMWRENTLNSFLKQVRAVTLENDAVIPALGTNKVLKFDNSPWNNNEIMDFPFEYSHEVPFPVSGKADHLLVDKSFDEVFSKASEFLA